MVLLSSLCVSCRQDAQPGERHAEVDAGTAPTDWGWPMVQHDRLHTGRSRAQGPHAPELVWQFRTSGRIVEQPAIGPDGSALVGDLDGVLYAVDGYGRETARRRFPHSVSSTPAVCASGRVLVQAGGILYGLSLPGLEMAWELDAGPLSAMRSPVPGDGGDVWLTSRRGRESRLLRVSEESGALLGSYELGETACSYPAVGDDGSVTVGGGPRKRGKLVRLASDGSPIWTMGPLKGNATRALALGPGGSVFAGTAGDSPEALCVSSDGSVVWRSALPADAFGCAVRPTNAVCFTCEDGSVVSYTATGDEEWRVGVGGSLTSSPAVDARGVVYIAAPDGRLVAIDPKGAQLWSFALAGPCTAGPSIDPNGRLYLGTACGDLWVVGQGGAASEGRRET